MIALVGQWFYGCERGSGGTFPSRRVTRRGTRSGTARRMSRHPDCLKPEQKSTAVLPDQAQKTRDHVVNVVFFACQVPARRALAGSCSMCGTSTIARQ